MLFRTLLVTCACLSILTTARAKEFRAEVAAGASARVDAPVSVLVSLAGTNGLAATVEAGGKTAPAQIVDVGGGKAEVSWIVDRLAAGESRTYVIRVGKSTKAAPSFAWKPSSADGLTSSDLVLGGQPVLRYMHTAFDRENIELTKKPFHHVFSPVGKGLITKGAGGLYPHHRGIYFGYKCRIDGQTYDTWHAHKGEHQTHVEVLEAFGGPVLGGHVVKIHWNGRDGKTFIEETRRLVAYRQSSGHHLIEFTSYLKPTRGPVDLGGDPQHAGVQIRPAQYVAENQKTTRFLRPAKWKDLPENKQINWSPKNKSHADMPWNAIRIFVGETPYTIAYLSHPKNPDDARASERTYGRFGEFFPWKLSADNPLYVKYRWWIAASHDVSREDVQGRYDALAAPPTVRLVK